MATGIEARLKELGITLPEAPAPLANYVPSGVSDRLVFIAGQLPLADGHLSCVGALGAEVGVEEGRAAARQCGLNILAQLRAAVGSLDRVTRCVRLGGYVNATAEFSQHPEVINGASDLMVEVFGDAGRHARAALGASGLPRGAAVEVEAVFEIEGRGDGAAEAMRDG